MIIYEAPSIRRAGYRRGLFIASRRSADLTRFWAQIIEHEEIEMTSQAFKWLATIWVLPKSVAKQIVSKFDLVLILEDIDDAKISLLEYFLGQSDIGLAHKSNNKVSDESKHVTNRIHT